MPQTVYETDGQEFANTGYMLCAECIVLYTETVKTDAQNLTLQGTTSRVIWNEVKSL